jgi:hypothetical protein
MKQVLALFLSAFLMRAAGPASWELSQYVEFSKGRFRGVGLTRDGVLVPGLAVEASAISSGETSLWSALAAANGATYLGSGPRGKIFASRPGAPLEDLGAPAPGHAFALATDSTGTLYAAISPGGQIFKRQGNSWQLHAQTGAKFVWAMQFTKDGALYAATGDEGRLYRIANGQSEIWWESGQANLTALALDAEGSLLVGSDPNGMLYRVTGKNSARVLYDAPFGEIRGIVPGPEGIVYFLAMGGLAAKRAGSATTTSGGGAGTVPQVTTTITVTDEAAAQGGLNIQPKPSAPATAQPTAASTQATPAMEIPGLDRSAIYRLNRDATVDQIFVTKEEAIFDLALRESKLYFTSDNHGRLYRLDADRQPTLLAESGENELSRLVPLPSGWLAVASSAGKAIRIAASAAPEGEYESPVHEAVSISRWGALDAESSPVFETRSGNSTKPDNTWSGWQALNGRQIASPAGRYLQWRMKPKGAFRVRSVTARYLPRNQAPVVKSITAALSISSQRVASTTAPAASAVYSLTVTDTGEAGASTSSGTSALLPTRPLLRQLLITWTSEDPDSDALEYKLEYRAEDETRWKLLKDNLADISYAIDADALADGRYFFRVTASDAPANTLGTALEGDLVSVPVELDQTPPLLTLSQSSGALALQAADEASPIRRLEYSLNGGPWRGIDPTDGILDSLTENATLPIGRLKLEAGENVLTVRATDAALNVAIRKLKLQN